jgi:hypothetical protein
MSSKKCDLKRHLVVLPSERNGREFRDKLLLIAESSSYHTTLPKVITPSHIPNCLYRLPGNSMADHHKLMQVLSICRRDERYNQIDSLELAEKLIALRRELGASLLGFGDVLNILESLDVPEKVISEIERLAKINDSYEGLLREGGRIDLDMQIKALLQQPDEYLANRFGTVHLIGCCEMRDYLVRLLKHAGIDVVVYIHASEEYREDFDEWGRLIYERWQVKRINIPNDRVIFVDRSLDQLQQVSEILSVQKEPVAIVPCERLFVPVIQDMLGMAGYNVSNTVSVENGANGFYRIVDAISKINVLTARELMGLFFSNPDFLSIMEEKLQEPCLRLLLNSQWDSFLATHLPGPDFMLSDLLTDIRVASYPVLDLVIGFFRNIFFCGDTGSEGCDELSYLSVVGGILNGIYASSLVEDPYIKHIHFCISIWEDLSISYNNESCFLDDHEYGVLIELYKRILRKISFYDVDIVDSSDEDATVSIIGWLDSALNSAKNLFVLSANEGLLPESERGDPLLPNAVRDRLGLPSRKTRLSRDKYILQTILNSDKNVRVLVPRSLMNGERSLVSRILLAQDIVSNARLVNSFFEDQNTSLVIKHNELSFFTRKAVDKSLKLTEVSVSALSYYIRCPYRFYLRYVEKIEPLSRVPFEIDGLEFGNIMHSLLFDVLKRERSGVNDIVALKKFAFDKIDDLYKRVFSPKSFATVAMQMESLKARMESFLRLHAEHRDAGWETIKLEYGIRGHVKDDELGVAPLPVVGKIDRIDVNRRLGEVRIIDYKVGEKFTSVESYHRKAGRIVNLQLPAYRHLVAQQKSILGLRDEVISVALFHIPASTENVCCDVAEWNEIDYTVFDREMVRIVTKINSSDYDEASNIDDEYSVLLMVD